MLNSFPVRSLHMRVFRFIFQVGLVILFLPGQVAQRENHLRVSEKWEF